MKRAVLLAHPSGHSLSPFMHDAAFRALGIDARYEAWDVPPDGLADAVQRLRSEDLLGANVTVPHKLTVMEHLDDVDDEARAIQAVNVVRREGRRLIGGNSDAAGLMRSLHEEGWSADGRTVGIVGAGGAARAAAFGVLAHGARSVVIVNRTAATRDALVANLAGRFGTDRVRACDDPARAVVDAWIQATSVGMERSGIDPDESPLPATVFDVAGDRARSGGARVAIDLVYRPAVPRFLRDARDAGWTSIGGLGMLIHQGAIAFEAWTGQRAPVDVMRLAATTALAGRSS